MSVCDTISRRPEDTEGYIALPYPGYYMTADDFCYWLLKDLNQPYEASPPWAKGETITYKKYDVIGYYATVESCLKGLRAEVLLMRAGDKSKKTIDELAEFKGRIDELCAKFAL